jgi:hypothetical protein
MADQADFYVKNKSAGAAITVSRKLPDGSTDLTTTIPVGSSEKIYLGGTDFSLIINGPTGKDTKSLYLGLKSDVDLDVSCCRTDSIWTIKIKPNSLPPEAPTTVNVTVGTNEPT